MEVTGRLVISAMVGVFGALWACAPTPTARDHDATAPDSALLPTAVFANDLNNSVHGGFAEPLAGLGSVSVIPAERLGVFVEPAPPWLDADLWVAEVFAACQAWQAALEAIESEHRRTFVRVARRDDAHIVIAMRDPDHHDDCDIGFSDPTETVGHAFEYAHACLAGEVHLNAGVRWVLNGSTAPHVFDVQSVVMHEVGHLLGLGHTATADHIMATSYPGVRRMLTQAEGEMLRQRLAAEAATEASQ